MWRQQYLRRVRTQVPVAVAAPEACPAEHRWRQQLMRPALQNTGGASTGALGDHAQLTHLPAERGEVAEGYILHI